MIDIQQNLKSGMDNLSLSEILADAELYSEIEKWAPPSFMKQGEILFRQGDAPGYAFFVKTGDIALTMHVSGDALWRVRATKGSLVGLPAIVGNEPYSMTEEVTQDSQICKITRDDFYRLTEQNPRLCCNVLKILAGEVHGARRALEFPDRILKSTHCGEEFDFSAGEQAFFREKQFQHDPKRCKKCKGHGPNARRRSDTRVNCAECGASTTVPFRPCLGKPVLCRSCFQRHRPLSHGPFEAGT